MLRFSPRKLREARGDRPIAEVALVADVTIWTVQRWETGKTEPDASRLARVAALTGKPIDFFFESAA